MKLSKLMNKIGWLLFIIMWIPFTVAMVIMAIELPDGEHSWSELPALSQNLFIVFFSLLVPATILIFGAPIVSGIHKQFLLQNGLPAEAVILEASDTGATINDESVVRLLLEVRSSDQPYFRAETEQVVSARQTSQIQRGSVVQVKYDPRNQSVTLDI